MNFICCRTALLIRALSLALLACHPTAIRAGDPAPAEAGAHEVRVKCAYVSTAPEQKPTGGTTDVLVKVTPSTTGLARVLFPASGLKSVDDPLQNSAWGAAFCAARATNHLITDFDYSITIRGDIEGPSGGLLFAAAMIAAINGDRVLPEVTISGTINPDGTAGPVDGLNSKMAGAHDGGITVFGYPVGCRIQEDKEAQQTIDLQDKAKILHVRAAELSDVNDAYELLTGKQLPKRAPLPEEKMQISSSLAQRMRNVASQHEINANDRLKKADWPKEMDGLWQKVRDELSLYKQHQAQGSFALGLYHSEVADADARLAEISTSLYVNRINRLDDVWRSIDEQRRVADEQLASLKNFLESRLNQTSVLGKLSGLYIYFDYCQARCWLDAAARLREMPVPKAAGGNNPAEERTGAMLKWLTLAEARADGLALWATNIEERGPQASRNEEAFQRLAKAYGTTADSGLNWFRSVIIKKYSLKGTPSAVEQDIANWNLEYVSALSNTRLAREAAKDTNRPLATADQLMFGGLAHLNVAGLINTSYNFPLLPPRDKMMRSHRQTFGRDLDLARQRVLQDCTYLQRELGVVPDFIALNYELANAWRDGTDEDRLNALRAYWRCSYFCDLVHTLLPDRARAFRPEAPF